MALVNAKGEQPGKRKVNCHWVNSRMDALAELCRSD
jgi:hypothetical protein